MKSSQATAEVFYTAFKALDADEREVFFEKVVSDPRFKSDIIDIALIEEAKKVKGRTVSARDYFKKRRSAKSA